MIYLTIRFFRRYPSQILQNMLQQYSSNISCLIEVYMNKVALIVLIYLHLTDKNICTLKPLTLILQAYIYKLCSVLHLIISNSSLVKVIDFFMQQIMWTEMIFVGLTLHEIHFMSFF